LKHSRRGMRMTVMNTASLLSKVRQAWSFLD
jgi:hypothetical protein